MNIFSKSHHFFLLPKALPDRAARILGDAVYGRDKVPRCQGFKGTIYPSPKDHTVDGWNPAKQLRLVVYVYPIIYGVFIHLRWLFGISEPSTVGPSNGRVNEPVGVWDLQNGQTFEGSGYLGLYVFTDSTKMENTRDISNGRCIPIFTV